jgi:hypothetical protein
MQGVYPHHAYPGSTDASSGFARRYFVLYNTGLLRYSFEPGRPVRDQVSLQHAAISTTPGRKDIHIDSNTATFHIKCLSVEDFNMWMAALRSAHLHVIAFTSFIGLFAENSSQWAVKQEDRSVRERVCGMQV